LPAFGEENLGTLLEITMMSEEKRERWIVYLFLRRGYLTIIVLFWADEWQKKIGNWQHTFKSIKYNEYANGQKSVPCPYVKQWGEKFSSNF
jgi:hypothetical protein